MLMLPKALWQLVIGACFCAYLSGCASPLRESTLQFRAGVYPEALNTLEEKAAEIAQRDLLLLHLNKGMVLHHLDRYEESNRELLAAAELIEALSRTSISEQASTLAVNEWLASYKGEYAEQLWVHSYLMMNFLLQNNPEGAAVEARRALKLYSAHPEVLKETTFTRALMATSFESVGLINDAYLEYKQLDDVSSDNTAIVDKLYSQALRLGFTDASNRYKKDLLSNNQSLPSNKPSHGELIVFLSQGDIPFKVSSNVFFPPDIRLSWPEYGYNNQPYHLIDVLDNKELRSYKQIESDFSALARASLYERGKSIAIKQALRVGAKRASAREVGNENALAGGLIEIALFILEEADTRGWDSLPAQMSMLRIPLQAGSHTIELSAQGQVFKAFPSVNIRNGQRVFRHARLESLYKEPEPVAEVNGPR